MLGKVAYLGSFRRRSADMTAGIFNSTVSRPPSISLTTVNLPPSILSSDANVP